MTLSASRLASLVRTDVRLQSRYGFYAVYIVVTLAFALGLRRAPDAELGRFVTLVVLGDPALLGFYFVGALVLFEKAEGVLDALVTSPVRASEYLLSKVLSLTLLAVVATFVVVLGAVGTAFDPLVLLVGVLLTVPLYVLVGFVAVARFDTINAYFMTALAYMTVLTLPMLGLLGLYETPLFYLFPVQASIVLVRAAFDPTTTTMLAYGVGYSLVATAIAWVFAHRAFVRHVVRDDGGAGASKPRPWTAATRPGVGRLAGRRRRRGPVESMVLADLKRWGTDPLLVYIGLSPLLIAVVARFGYPAAAASLSGRVDLLAYADVAVAFVAAFAPATFGFVAGFLVLEDRDQGLVAAFRTTPLTGRGYLLYRELSVVVLSAVAGAVAVPLAGLVAVPPAVLAVACAVSALWAAVTSLLLGSLASNSVEGVAVSKVLGLLVMVPLFGLLAVPEPWQYLFGVFPPFWTIKLFVVGVASGTTAEFVTLAVAGVFAHLVVAGVLARRFLARPD
ncbi:ABC transporter permease [Halogeometricum limi]|uniref:Fluoroquinolone transport system permease protein n=1 Tax=Halogeometricum limi TaxID=555875 RepID=A0A1I6I2Y3_9EURY|nr:ABC transporter permease [Halogeometricum limi]SFR61024.1 fluoroquinolone transport system permease protein [Halogeometricum limi]